MARPAAAHREPGRPRPLDPVPDTPDPRATAVLRLLRIVDRLRDPEGGCPWDLEQSVESLAPALIEEAHEVAEAIEQGNERAMVEEAGDLLMGLCLVCHVADQAGRFDVARVATEVGDKLIRRHPHVFDGTAGDAVVDGAAHAIANWEAIKQSERAARKGDDASALAGVPTALPALQRAQRIGAKAMATGFRWADADGALAKVREEAGELAEAFEALRRGDGDRAAVEHELGDVLIAAAQLANYLELDAEGAARAAARRFEARFRAMEAELGGRLRGESLDVLMAAWGRAKVAVAGERP